MVGRGGARTIPADAFFTGMFSSVLAPDEVLVEVRVPFPPARTGGAYEKCAGAASGYAVVGVAAVVTLDAGGVVQGARVAITGLAAHAARLTAVENALAGSWRRRPTRSRRPRSGPPGNWSYEAR